MSSHPPARLMASDGSQCTVRVPVGKSPPFVLWFRGRCYRFAMPAVAGIVPMIYWESTSITLTEGALVDAEGEN